MRVIYKERTQSFWQNFKKTTGVPTKNSHYLLGFLKEPFFEPKKQMEWNDSIINFQKYNQILNKTQSE